MTGIYELKSRLLHAERSRDIFEKRLRNCEILTKGTLFIENAVRKSRSGKIYRYTYNVFEIVSYKHGKKKAVRKRISDEDAEIIRDKLKRKATNRGYLRELYKAIKRYINELVRLEHKGLFNFKLFTEIKKHISEHNFRTEGDPHYRIITDNGEYVRSKLECIYANEANAAELQYFYEYPLKLNKIVLHPDFTHVINGKRIYVELLGLMDDERYIDDFKQRLSIYMTNGIKLGENLVCIACNNGNDLNAQVICKVIMDLNDGIVPDKVICASDLPLPRIKRQNTMTIINNA